MHPDPARCGRYEAEKALCPGNLGIVEPDVQPSFITIARIIRTRGNRGEVAAVSYTDFPERFDKLEEVWLEFGDGHRELIALEKNWEYKGRRIFKFAGIDSISSAERLKDCWIQVPGDQAVELPEGSYFDHDLIGCSVIDIDILRIEGNNQLVVEGSAGECLIPAAADICTDISIEKKRIVVDPPEGLIDLDK
jgi:16S rRNA processing protein RimM